ncbi:hypothetical protein BDD16_001097 [Sphaerotilus montanus]|uniref:Uncharacterized protein n=1 Tax=Sphaerotilus montanus TaxID=522889 RepID=A0A7Y9U604_9BURK|nr:hypothetical protein [Sphaerotilus montanus]
MSSVQKNVVVEDAFILSLRLKVREMKELVDDVAYELLLSKSDKLWLKGISTRLEKKAKILAMSKK